jgi:hypothetical protein
LKPAGNLRDAQVTLIDIRAGLLSKTLATLSEIGFLAGAKDGRIKISVVHVIASNKASFDEIEATANAVEGAKHYVLLNHTNKSKFVGLPASVSDPIIVPMLNELAADTVDHLGIGFDAYLADQIQSPTLQGYIRARAGPASSPSTTGARSTHSNQPTSPSSTARLRPRRFCLLMR